VSCGQSFFSDEDFDFRSVHRLNYLHTIIWMHEENRCAETAGAASTVEKHGVSVPLFHI
jgi:hypothetical protein